MTKHKEETKSKPSTAKAKEIIFTCKYCGKNKPLSEMVVVSRFSPQLISCKACEKTAF